MFSPEMMKMAQEQMANMTPEQMAAMQRQMASMDPATMQAQMAQAQAMMGNMSPDQIKAQFAQANSNLAGGDNVVTGANALKEEGNALHNQGKYAEAAEKYQAAKRKIEGNVSATAQQVKKSCCLNLASCYLKTGQHELVIEECGEVMHAERSNLKALYRRGQAYAALGRNSMAESDLAAAQQVNPQDEHVAAALQEVRAKLEAAGEGGDYSFDGDTPDSGGSDVSGGLAALAAAFKASGGEKEGDEGVARERQKEEAGQQGASAGISCAAASGVGTVATRQELEVKSIKELREMCKGKGLDTASCTDKHDLVDLILSNPHATAAPAFPPAASSPSAGVGVPGMGNMSAAQIQQAKMMMENPGMMQNAVNMMKNMDPATLANMFNMQHGTTHWTPEMAKQYKSTNTDKLREQHVDMMQQPGVVEKAAQQMKTLSPEQLNAMAKQNAHAPGRALASAARPVPAAPAPAAAAAAGRIDPDDMRSALSTPAANGAPVMTPQMKAQMDMMKNNPEMMKQSIEMMKNMDPDTMAKMLEAQASMTGMKVTPEMAKMSAQMMANMDPTQMEHMMSMASSMGAGNGMGAMGGMHTGVGEGGAAQRKVGAQRGAAPGMPGMQMDPATGMPIVTPEMQKQMSQMMRDPEMRKNISSMMKSMDPEMMRSMGISDASQIEKAADMMEKLSPEQVDRIMGVAVWGQRAYIFYKTHLWFRCLLQLCLMYLVYWAFGGLFMRVISFFTGSSSASAPAVDDVLAPAAGASVRDWSGSASAAIGDDDDDEDIVARPETKHGRVSDAARASAAAPAAGAGSDADDEEL